MMFFSGRFSFNAVLLILLSGGVLKAIPEGETEESRYSRQSLDFLAAPYLSGSSDAGLEIGLMAGVARSPDLMAYFCGYHSSGGHKGLSLRGEYARGRVRVVTANYLTKIATREYPAREVSPPALAEADVSRIQVNLTLFRSLRSDSSGTNSIPTLEAGPDLALDIARSDAPRTLDGAVASDKVYRRFKSGKSVQIGVRGRYRTTSAQRPLNGVVLDGTLRTGIVECETFAEPRFEQSLYLSAAAARQMTSEFRLYFRLRAAWQNHAAPINRNWLGGDQTLRGQPDRRDLGRRLAAARSQAHLRVIRGWKGPMRLVHHVAPFFPIMAMDLETVAFFDAGRCGDPDFGWLPWRQGCGGGVRFVFPPELVAAVDVAVSPGGSVRYYLSLGEML